MKQGRRRWSWRAFVRLRRAFPPALLTLARVRLQRLSPIGNRRNPPPRAENAANFFSTTGLSADGKTEERLHARRVEGHEPSLSIALPIFVAAADENREELQDIWARLLAAAADPARAKSFRLAFIETAKKMDPLDAAVLQGVHDVGGAVTGQNRNTLAEQLHASRDEIDVSFANLTKLELVYSGRPGSADPASISPFGREFLRAVSD